MILLATIVAAVVSFIAVKWLLRFVQSHTFFQGLAGPELPWEALFCFCSARRSATSRPYIPTG